MRSFLIGVLFLTTVAAGTANAMVTPNGDVLDHHFSSNFVDTGTVTTDVEVLPGQATRLRLNLAGLTGTLDPESADASPSTQLTIHQQQSLVVNLSIGVVEGTASGAILTPDGTTMSYMGTIAGRALCFERQNDPCGRVVLRMTFEGAWVGDGDDSRFGSIDLPLFQVLDHDGQGQQAQFVALRSEGVGSISGRLMP